MTDKELKKKKVTCEWPNVWTSAGKILKGETAMLPADEASALKKSGAVK